MAHIETNVGNIRLNEIDESTKTIAEKSVDSPLGKWEECDELVLADRDGYGWAWIPVKEIKDNV